MRRRLVHFVQHHDGLEVELQRLGQHKAGLRHGAFGGIHQQQDAIGQIQDALHLPAEVRVAGGVNEVDLDPRVAHGNIFGEDGDAALALECVVVEDARLRGRIAPGHVELAQDGIHQRGLAVIHVGDDGNVANGRGGVHAVGVRRRDYTATRPFDNCLEHFHQ